MNNAATIETFTHPTDGVSARVFHNAAGKLCVQLKDDDSGETVAVKIGYAEVAAAVADAKHLVGVS